MITFIKYLGAFVFITDFMFLILIIIAQIYSRLNDIEIPPDAFEITRQTTIEMMLGGIAYLIANRNEKNEKIH